ERAAPGRSAAGRETSEPRDLSHAVHGPRTEANLRETVRLPGGTLFGGVPRRQGGSFRILTPPADREERGISGRRRVAGLSSQVDHSLRYECARTGGVRRYRWPGPHLRGH